MCRDLNIEGVADTKSEQLKEILIKAGDLVMQIYEKEFDVEYKADNSPLTRADLLANEFLSHSLGSLYPQIPILSEEGQEVAYAQRKGWGYYWCIDPIDGTKEFVHKNGEFTINVALMQKGEPIASFIYVPVLKTLYYAFKKRGAYKQKKGEQEIVKLPLQKREDHECIAYISRSRHTAQTQNFLDSLLECKRSVLKYALGSSLKLCFLAEGRGDIYAKFSQTMEWDTAAGHLILQESGGEIYIYDDTLRPCEYLSQNVKDLSVLRYNKEDLRNPHFIALGV